ncbi:DUF5681 domain-containing protein [Reyranella soli]|uniref:DUF5681 domain-containing protein n=1 Tax=Reyranella soli TaxID=1230389 RepID=A0A512NTF9_9HYPH|nr:DUF5681 domain-containing protein [Reyranella soli]GEP62152.1 hypothetical protein RSO01_93180 [Reyranella soli]
MKKTRDKGGYGKPPEKNRFQKGKSGNPKGRPKRTQENKSLQQMLRDLALREFVGQFNGKQTKVTFIEAVFLKQFSEAMKGNTAAAKFLVSLFEKHVPLNRSLAELMKDTPVFALTAKDKALFKKSELLRGVTFEEDSQDQQ